MSSSTCQHCDTATAMTTRAVKTERMIRASILDDSTSEARQLAGDEQAPLGAAGRQLDRVGIGQLPLKQQGVRHTVVTWFERSRREVSSVAVLSAPARRLASSPSIRRRCGIPSACASDMTVRELRAALHAAGLDTSSIFEREELERLFMRCQDQDDHNPNHSSSDPSYNSSDPPIATMHVQEIMDELQERGERYDVLAPEPLLRRQLEQLRYREAQASKAAAKQTRPGSSVASVQAPQTGTGSGRQGTPPVREEKNVGEPPVVRDGVKTGTYSGYDAHADVDAKAGTEARRDGIDGPDADAIADGCASLNGTSTAKRRVGEHPLWSQGQSALETLVATVDGFVSGAIDEISRGPAQSGENDRKGGISNPLSSLRRRRSALRRPGTKLALLGCCVGALRFGPLRAAIFVLATALTWDLSKGVVAEAKQIIRRRDGQKRG